jgi:succinoglycan biosynthesis protein ExoL
VKLTYFVHDLNDPAVHRRVRMLREGGAEVTLLGFHRGATPTGPDGISLGRTDDARLAARAVSVAGAVIAAPSWRAAVAGAEIVLARQLEMLPLAAIARRLHAPRATLGYECLDLHALLTRRSLPGVLLRGLERVLLARCDTLLVSSEAFVHAHFAPRLRTLPRVALVENKLLRTELPPSPPPRPDMPPWRIGWFGMLRCRRSLHLLAGLARAFDGAVEVVLRGRVARHLMAEFDAIVAAGQHLRFLGPYRRPADLAAIYGEVHFAWCVDFYEAGANSEWLLPNRLYEGGAFGAVAVARAQTATGAWLARHGAGLPLAGDCEETLHAQFAAMTPGRYAALRDAWARIPASAFVHDAADARGLLADLAAPGGRA